MVDRESVSDAEPSSRVSVIDFDCDSSDVLDCVRSAPFLLERVSVILG